MNTRRRFLASAASVSAAEPRPGGAPPHSDAGLLGLIGQFNALEHRINDLYPDGATPIEDEATRDQAARPLRDQQQELLDRICSIRAVTPEGIAARASSLILWAPDLFRDMQTDGYWDERMMAAISDHAFRDEPFELLVFGRDDVLEPP